MKVEKEEETFKPFTLIIKIESEEEAKALYAIFNNIDNSELLGITNCDKLRDSIGEDFRVDKGIIVKGITAEKYYECK